MILEATVHWPGQNGSARTEPNCVSGGCNRDYVTLFLNGALITVACFMEYPTRVSVWEQKCSLELYMFVAHRGAVVVDGCLHDLVLEEWSGEADMPPRHLHNHPWYSPLLALTNDRRLGETRHLHWGI